MTTALLVMDMQVSIVGRLDAAEHVVARHAAAAAAARAHHVPVIFVRLAFQEGHPEVSPRNRMFSTLRQQGAFTPSDPGGAWHPDLEPQPGDVVVSKRRVSAFTGSELELVLRAAGADALVLGGLATSGVVLSTLREAADRDFELTVLSDGCADGDPEVHRVLLEKLFPRQATVVDVAAWVSSLDAPAAPPPAP